MTRAHRNTPEPRALTARANRNAAVSVGSGALLGIFMDKPLTEYEWIEAVFLLLCASQGAPENDTEARNLREWAQAMAENYYIEYMTPQEAHDEEMSCA